MTAKPRNYARLATSVRHRSPKWMYLLIAMLNVSVCNVTAGGQHFTDAAAQRVVGCIDGQCGPPSSPFGHYRGSWRRWPHSKDTSFDTRPTDTTVAEPLVPEAFDESRTRTRTRSDRPLDPKDMGIGPGLDAKPLLPDPTNSNTPFNNPVEEPDLPDPPDSVGGPADAAGSDFFAPPAVDSESGNNGDSLFDIPVTPPSDAPAGSESGIDLFDQSGVSPAAPSKARKLGMRLIKSRGVNLQARGRLTTTPVSSVALSGEIEIPAEPGREASSTNGEIGLTSFLAPTTIPADVSADPPTSVSTLSDIQIQDTEKLPGARESDTPPTHIVPSPMHGNPLRRELTSQTTTPEPKRSERTTSSVTEVELDVEPFEDAIEEPRAARVLGQSVARRSLRDTIRKNPLR